MELCLMIEGQEGVTWDDWVAIARACEAHGVPALYRSDHHMNLDGHPERGSLDAWATIAALAATTTTLRLGTLVSPVTFRHPSTLAKLVTAADRIAGGGRVELGLGAGWHDREHAAYGFPFPPLRERMDMLEEQLAIVHGHWAGEPFGFDGDHYRLEDLDAQPKPADGRPRVLMGGDAGPRAARLAARWADEYNTVYPTVEQVRERRDRIAAACEAAGREPIPFSVMTGVLVAPDEATLRRRGQVLADEQGLEADPARLRESEPAFIVGTPDQAAEQLAALRDAGAARVMLQHLVHTDLDTIALIGEELAPRLAA
jgi:F420-dependent oxidoreductase-like protein